MVKRRRKCKTRVVMVAKNRCARVNCHDTVVKGRVKCGRKLTVKRSSRRVVVTKGRKCKHGHVKGTKKCRKTSKRRVVHTTKRRKSRKVPCSKHPMMKKCRGKARKPSHRTKRRKYL